MGCFIGCFGKSKDRKRRNQKKNRVLPQDKQSPGFPISHHNDTLIEQRANDSSSPINLVSELRDNKPEEKSSSSTKKRVTFDSNVKTYEHVSLNESIDSLPKTKSITAKDTEIVLAKVNKPLLLSSEDNSVSSSIGSYTPNYRYQNCTDSEDEIQECCDSDLDNVDDDDCEEDYIEGNHYEEDYIDDDGYVDNDAFVGQKSWSRSNSTASMGSRTENLSTRATEEDAESALKMSTVADNDMENVRPLGNARDRSDYVHPVLNPVENLTQWKTVKSRCAYQLTPQKENFSLVTETSRIVKRSSSHVKPKSSAPYDNDVAVDASLSTWLSSSTCESLTPKKTTSFEAVTSEKLFKLQSPNGSSARSLEDRPILGAWTVEELKHLSKTSSSPRRSPSRSPDEMPIIGSVGTYWNDSIADKDSPSVTSFKGFANTSSKY